MLEGWERDTHDCCLPLSPDSSLIVPYFDDAEAIKASKRTEAELQQVSSRRYIAQQSALVSSRTSCYTGSNNAWQRCSARRQAASWLRPRAHVTASYFRPGGPHVKVDLEEFLRKTSVPQMKYLPTKMWPFHALDELVLYSSDGLSGPRGVLCWLFGGQKFGDMARAPCVTGLVRSAPTFLFSGREGWDVQNQSMRSEASDSALVLHRVPFFHTTSAS